MKLQLTLWVEAFWYNRRPETFRHWPRTWWLISHMAYLWLWPLSCFYRILFNCKRQLSTTKESPCSTIVIGNYTVGGTGKTPMVIALAQALTERGLCVGILAHGYQSASHLPSAVYDNPEPILVGDEACLMRMQCPNVSIWVGRPRLEVLKLMKQKNPKLHIILVDDGLQDFGFKRQAEILMLPDHSLKNAQLLPLGPLRQPLTDCHQPSHCSKHRIVVRCISNSTSHEVHAQPTENNTFNVMGASLGVFDLCNMSAEHSEQSLQPFSTLIPYRCHLFTAIARYWRILENLKTHSINPIVHAYPDHYPLTYRQILADLDTARAHQDDRPSVVLLSEKDAIKVINEESYKNADVLSIRFWVIAYRIKIASSLIDTLMPIIEKDSK